MSQLNREVFVDFYTKGNVKAIVDLMNRAGIKFTIKPNKYSEGYRCLVAYKDLDKYNDCKAIMQANGTFYN